MKCRSTIGNGVNCEQGLFHSGMHTATHSNGGGSSWGSHARQWWWWIVKQVKSRRGYNRFTSRQEVKYWNVVQKEIVRSGSPEKAFAKFLRNQSCHTYLSR